MDVDGELAIERGAGHERVGEGRRHAGRDLGGDIDGQLRPVDHTTEGLQHEHRADDARRVDGRRRGGCHRDDGREHDESDRQTGPPRRRLPVDDTEDHEHEDERADELGEEALHVPDAERGVELGHAEADLVCPGSEHADDREGADGGAGELGGEVLGHVLPRELARDRQPDRHRRVDVVAGDVTERVHGRHDHGREGQ